MKNENPKVFWLLKISQKKSENVRPIQTMLENQKSFSLE